MRDFGHLRKKHKMQYSSIIYSIPVIFLLLILAILMSRQTWEALTMSLETDHKLEEAAVIYANVKAKEDELQASITRLHTEDGIEAEIRDTYGFVREGEEMIVIVNNEEEEEEIIEIEDESFWARVRSWF